MNEATAPRGNVLFITVDQWRGDCLSAAGHPVVETPALDALAARGVRFANHWANIAPCGPSRATLHTGMYAQNHRSVLNGTPLDDRFTNIALAGPRCRLPTRRSSATPTHRSTPAASLRTTPGSLTYEEVLPGFDAVLFTPETAGSPGGPRGCGRKASTFLPTRADLYLPDRSIPGRR